MKLSRAILFDLDDTILVAFGPAQSQWERTIAALAGQLGPIEATVIAAAIEAASTELWSDPARHKSCRASGSPRLSSRSSRRAQTKLAGDAAMLAMSRNEPGTSPRMARKAPAHGATATRGAKAPAARPNFAG